MYKYLKCSKMSAVNSGTFFFYCFKTDSCSILALKELYDVSSLENGETAHKAGHMRGSVRSGLVPDIMYSPEQGAGRTSVSV